MWTDLQQKPANSQVWLTHNPLIAQTNIFCGPKSAHKDPERQFDSVFLLRESEVPWMEAAAEKSRSATVLDLQAWTYYNLY